MPHRRTGSRYWWIIVDGVRQSSRTEIYEDAEALEARLTHQKWKKHHMGVKEPRSWKQAVIKYLKEHQHNVSYETTVQRLRWWDEHLGGIDDIREINREMIDSIITEHRNITPLPSSANSTANKYVGVVGAVLNAACREWSWIESSPKFRLYPKPDHRNDWLTVEEWQSLEAELPKHLQLAARFALATGLRAAKVFCLEWSQIDFNRRAMSFSGNRIKRGNTIPLNDTAMGVLEEIRRGGSVHIHRVFTWRGLPLESYGRAWDKAKARAGVDITWHGLRHTFASWLGQAGVPAHAIDQLCGWAEKDTRGIYTHLDVEPLRPYCVVIDMKLGKMATQTTGFVWQANA